MDPVIEGPLISFNSLSISPTQPSSPTALLLDLRSNQSNLANNSPLQQSTPQHNHLPNGIGSTLRSSLTQSLQQSSATPQQQQQQQSTPQLMSPQTPSTATTQRATPHQINMQPKRLVDFFDEPKSVVQSTSCNSIAALAASCSTSSFMIPTRPSLAPALDPLIIPLGQVMGGGGSAFNNGGESPTVPGRSSVHQHRRSVSETTSNAISHAVSSGTLSETDKTQMLVLIGLYDDPSTKAVMLDGTPMKWRATSLQQHFDSFYEDLFLELTKFGIIEDLVVTENFFWEFRSSVFVRYHSVKAASVAYDNFTSGTRLFAGRKVEARFIPLLELPSKRCVDNENSMCLKGNICPLVHAINPSTTLKLRLFEMQRVLTTSGIEGVNRTVHIRQLPRTVTELDLRNVFESCGKISSCRFVDEESTVSAFVEFESEHALKSAMLQDGKQWRGFTFRLSVMRATKNNTSWSIGKLISHSPNIQREHSHDAILLSQLPQGISSSDLKDFVNATMLRQIGLENGNNLITSLKIDSENNSSILKFSSSTLAGLSLCLNKIAFRDTRLSVSRIAMHGDREKRDQPFENFLHDMSSPTLSSNAQDALNYVINRVKRLNSLSSRSASESSRMLGSNGNVASDRQQVSEQPLRSLFKAPLNINSPTKKISIVKSPRKYETFDELEPKLNSSIKMVPKKTEPTPVPQNPNLLSLPTAQIASTSPPIDDLLSNITSTPTVTNISNISTNLLYSPIVNSKPYLQMPPIVLNPKEDESTEHSLISFSNSGIAKQSFGSPRKETIVDPPKPPPPPPLKGEEPLFLGPSLTGSDEGFEELDLGDSEIDYSDLQIIKQIGEGGYGTVTSATWRGKMVAVKQLRLNNTDASFLGKFRKEVAILSKLRHPNILLFMAVTKPPNICLVTEFLSKSMWDILHNPKIMISVPFLFKNAKDVALGMNYLHLCEPAIIHRDLKSPNLMLDEGNNIKVCDFGLSRIKQAGTMTGRIGTPAWTAPEVLRNKPYSEKADVYSYGIVLYEFFSRQVPFANMEPIQIAIAVVNGKMRPPVPNNCPPFMAQLMQDCWDEDPDKRPSFAEILNKFSKAAPLFTPRGTSFTEGLTVL
eukprot:TRINITY_DN1648_c0_g1_i1.p1 TRINITY_DN1648_c0_g1~~TRINITY_DN1648_c0_g1_i1.p1  ORF type:complete len:1101 (+),score=241.37 TRINITY_DN1648_c0_g1_i1:399-3701(+)